MGRHLTKRIAVACAAAAATFALATAVQASIPGSNGVIHGCYQFNAPNTSKGVLRVIDADRGEGCRFNEHPLSWNQRGVTGPTGATGLTGASGPKGATGPTGPGAVESIGTKTLKADIGEYALVLDCPQGQIAEDAWVESTDPTAFLQRDSFNEGETTNGIPTGRWVDDVSISGPTTLAIYWSCVTPSQAFGFAPANGGHATVVRR